MDHTSLNKVIDLELLARLQSFFSSKNRNVYLVGGAVRDIVLNRKIHDIDFAVDQGAIKLAFNVASVLGCAAFVLDKERDAGRVVLSDKNITIDIAAFRADTLTEDLRLRDFTINAMALDLAELESINIIDPFGGLDSIKQKKIEPTHHTAISSDPLRAYRAIRLGVELDFTLSTETLQLIESAQPMMNTIAGERVKDELVRILNSPDSPYGLNQLLHLGLRPFACPNDDQDNPNKAKDQQTTTIDFFSALEKLNKWVSGETEVNTAGSDNFNDRFSSLRPALETYFTRKVTGDFNGWSLLKFGALFASIISSKESAIKQQEKTADFQAQRDDISEFITEQIAYLRLSRAAQKHIGTMIAGRSHPIWMARNGLNSRREIFKFFREHSPAGVDIAWLSIAWASANQLNDNIAVDYYDLISLVRKLMESYFWHYDTVISPELLINGKDIIERLNIQPGPEVGDLLEHVKEAQAAGEVDTKDQALNLAEQYSAILASR